jgi:uncharacterized protein YfcZ (UPF0381/DUF406 family)
MYLQEQDVTKHESPYQNSEQPAEELLADLKEIGFKVESCNVLNKSYTFANFEDARGK